MQTPKVFLSARRRSSNRRMYRHFFCAVRALCSCSQLSEISSILFQSLLSMPAEHTSCGWETLLRSLLPQAIEIMCVEPMWARTRARVCEYMCACAHVCLYAEMTSSHLQSRPRDPLPRRLRVRRDDDAGYCFRDFAQRRVRGIQACWTRDRSTRNCPRTQNYLVYWQLYVKLLLPLNTCRRVGDIAIIAVQNDGGFQRGYHAATDKIQVWIASENRARWWRRNIANLPVPNVRKRVIHDKVTRERGSVTAAFAR